MKINARKTGTTALLISLTVLLVMVCGCTTQEDTGLETQVIEDVTLEEAYTLIIDNLGNKDFIIIDVRTPEEYAAGHIEKAINLDYNSETFKDEIDELDKSQSYLIYCRTDRRSGLALDIMKELGFEEVYNLLGGTEEWERDKLPLEK